VKTERLYKIGCWSAYTNGSR